MSALPFKTGDRVVEARMITRGTENDREKLYHGTVVDIGARGARVRFDSGETEWRAVFRLRHEEPVAPATAPASTGDDATPRKRLTHDDVVNALVGYVGRPSFSLRGDTAVWDTSLGRLSVIVSPCHGAKPVHVSIVTDAAPPGATIDLAGVVVREASFCGHVPLRADSATEIRRIRATGDQRVIVAPLAAVLEDVAELLADAIFYDERGAPRDDHAQADPSNDDATASTRETMQQDPQMPTDPDATTAPTPSQTPPPPGGWRGRAFATMEAQGVNLLALWMDLGTELAERKRVAAEEADAAVAVARDELREAEALVEEARKALAQAEERAARARRELKTFTLSTEGER